MADSIRSLERKARKLERKAAILQATRLTSVFGRNLEQQEKDLEKALEEANQPKEPSVRKMSFAERIAEDVSRRKRNALMNMRTADKAEAVNGYLRPIHSPKFLANLPEVTRASQWLAGLTLPIFIIVTLVIDVATLQVLTDVFLQDPAIASDQLPIMQFLVTAIGLGIYILSAWAWFLFVKTGGFGLYAF